MNKKILILLAIMCILLTACTFNIKIPKAEGSGNNTAQKTEAYLDDIYMLKVDDVYTGSDFYYEETEGAYIQFFDDNTFTIYTGYDNYLGGAYFIDDDIISCNILTFSNVYSPVQDISANVKFKIKDNYFTLQVLSSSQNFTVKTTNMNDDGEWVYDGGEKELTMAPFMKDISFKLYLPET